MKALENFEEYKDLLPVNRHAMVRGLIELAHLEGQNAAFESSNKAFAAAIERLEKAVLP